MSNSVRKVHPVKRTNWQKSDREVNISYVSSTIGREANLIDE